MNSDFVRWLLDIDAIPRGAESLRLAWERPFPAWAWAILFIACGLFAIWSYGRLVGSRAGRGILAGARFAILLLALVLVSGPMLELPRETVEEDWVLLLADRSASMTIEDVQRAGVGSGVGAGGRESRDAQLKHALTNASPVLSLLDSQRQMVWMGFDAGAFNLQGDQPSANSTQPSSATPGDQSPIDNRQSSIPDLGVAAGRRSNIEAALEQALQRAAARPVSGIVLMTDGRADAPLSRALVRRLQADAISVFVVPLGAEEPLGDLAVADVEAPRRAFVHDKVPVVVDLDRFGAAAGDLSGVVRLIDQASGEELDRIDLSTVETTGEDKNQVTLTAEPKLAGDSTWQVVIETPEKDLVPDNNLRTFNIELVDRPLRVLYVEGYPRWEYRYVKELIRREESIESSVMLISASSDFAQEGNVPITRLPRSPEEFAAYDVIILGDIPAGFFSPEQLDMMRAHVAERGAGLLWIAGERSVPSTYAGSVLSDLLPMRGTLNLPAIGAPITIEPTPQAARLGVLQLASGEDVGWPPELSDPATGWSRLFYAQRIEPGQLKPAVEVLAQTVDPNAASAELGGGNSRSFPIVMSMRYGAGQSMYVATDEIWRWRYGRGEQYPDQFWMQMIRMLGRESLSAGGNQAVLEVNPRRAQVGAPLRIELRLLDAQLLQRSQATVRIALRNEKGEVVAEVDLKKVEGSEDRFAATYLPDVAGQYDVIVDDPAFATVDLRSHVEVYAPDDELRRPETDHELLRSLASATGGKVIAPEDLGTLPALLPNREVRTLNPLTEPIWDTPLMLMLMLGLLTFEWVGRKMLRLA